METENDIPEVSLCPLCDRIIAPGQKHCPCGWRVISEPALPVTSFFQAALFPVIPLLGSLWLLYIIRNPSVIMFTPMPLIKAVGVTVIASAALAVVTADKAERENWALQPAPMDNLTPLSWFVVTLLVWPVAYPLFVIIHFWKSARLRVILSIALSLAFIVGFFWIILFSRNQVPSLVNRPGPVTKGTPAPAPQPAPGMVVVPQAGSPSPGSSAETPVPAPVSGGAPAIPPVTTPVPPIATATPWVPPQAPPPPQARSKPSNNKTANKADRPEVGVDILKAR